MTYKLTQKNVSKDGVDIPNEPKIEDQKDWMRCGTFECGFTEKPEIQPEENRQTANQNISLSRD